MRADDRYKEGVFIHNNGATSAEPLDDLDAVRDDSWQVEEVVGAAGGEEYEEKDSDMDCFFL